MSAAPRSRTAPAIAMPATAPVDRGWLDDADWVDVAADAAADVEDGVGAVEEVVGTISEGKYCPGLNINVAFFAYASCVSNVSVAFCNG
jgi:hypothetical protein